MTTSDLPNEGTAGPLTYEQGVNELARLLDTPETGPVKAQDQEQPEPEDDEAEGDELEAEASEETSEVEDEQEDADAEDGPDAKPEPVIAADEAVVTLQDGTQITVGELKRNNLFQRDYSKKTEELKAEKNELEGQRQQVLQHAQRLAQQRDFYLELQKQFVPPMPDDNQLREDPIGYWEARNAHESAVARINQMQQHRIQEQQQAQQKQQAEMARFVEQERARLLQHVPELKDQTRLNKVRTEMADVFKREYGLAPEEYANFTDHRAVRIMLDALEYRKLKAQKPAVEKKIADKPPLLKSGKRQTESREVQRKRQASETLRKTGSRDALVEVLKGFDL